MTDAPGRWVSLAEYKAGLLANVPKQRREDEQWALMERIASGQYRIRYLNADELRPQRDIPRLIDPSKDTEKRAEEWRDGNLLPADFFRAGRVNWVFSMVTFAGRTIKDIEIFVPDAVEADRDAGPRKPSSLLVIDEARKRLDAGVPPGATLKAFSAELSEWLRFNHPHDRMVAKAVENAIRGLWREKHKHF